MGSGGLGVGTGFVEGHDQFHLGVGEGLLGVVDAADGGGDAGVAGEGGCGVCHGSSGVSAKQ